MDDLTAALSPAQSTVPSTTLPRASIGLLVAIVIGDWFFWNHALGVNFALYILLLAGLVYLNRPAHPFAKSDCVIVGLLALGVIQCGLRSSLSNTLVLLALLIYISGHTLYNQLGPIWVRWIQGVLGSIKFPQSIAQFIYLVQTRTVKLPQMNEKLSKLWSVSWLGLGLLIVFTLILSAGNALLAERLEGIYSTVTDFILEVALPSPSHIVFLIFLSGIALVLILPGRFEIAPNRWHSELPEIPVSQEGRSIAVMRSTIALVAVNGLFLMTNSLDVSHLWLSEGLPRGVGYSQYVHEGVGSLNFAVVLSAIVLTLVFQQGGGISRSKPIKALALLWILQNLFLVLGVYLRLKLYIDAHWLTPKRIYVGIFLLLIVTGYAFLSWHIFKNRSVKKLLLRNAMAVGILFYAIQFFNVRAIVADYNFAQWERNPEHHIGNDFQSVLGFEIVPLMIKVAESGFQNESVNEAKALLNNRYHNEKIRMVDADWQAWEYRTASIRKMLFNYHDRLHHTAPH